MTDLPILTREDFFAQLDKKRAEAGRSCGDCQVCCEAINIPEANTPAGSKCQHQCDSGCAIYDQRPSPCQSYHCSWLDGYGREEDRPDRSGVLLETMSCNGLTLIFWLSDVALEDREEMVDSITSPGTVVVAVNSDSMVVSSECEADRDLAIQVVTGLYTGSSAIQMKDQDAPVTVTQRDMNEAVTEWIREIVREERPSHRPRRLP